MGGMERIQRGGRPVQGFGVGATTDVGAGIAVLQSALAQPGVTVAGLQTAGNAAVGSVGPAIDALSGSNPDVMKMTQLAWQQNGKLAGVKGSDVDTAKGIVSQIITLYQQAAKLAAPGFDLLGWLAANQTTALIVGGAVVVAGVALVALRPVARAA
jgi:hypothetical protein